MTSQLRSYQQLPPDTSAAGGGGSGVGSGGAGGNNQQQTTIGGGGGGPASRASNSGSSSNSSNNNPNRPPAQVFTRGTTGAVKTRRNNNNNGNDQQQAYYEAPPRRQQQQQQQQMMMNYPSSSTTSAASQQYQSSSSATRISPRSASSAPVSRGGPEYQASPSSLYNNLKQHQHQYYHQQQHNHQNLQFNEMSPITSTIITASTTNTSNTPSGTTSMNSFGSYYNANMSTTSNANSNSNSNNYRPRVDSNDGAGFEGTASSIQSAPSYGSGSGGGKNNNNGGGGNRGGSKPSNNSGSSSRGGGGGDIIFHPLQKSVSSSKYRELSPSRSSHDSEGHKAHSKTSRRVLDDLSRAQGSERRIAALSYVCECFDHNDEIKHNIELSMGALSVLNKCLGVATHDDEIRITISAFEMVLRASIRTVQLAYGKVGGTSLLISLLRIVERCEVLKSMNHAEISILNISKILAYLSRCADLRASLSRQAGVLESLTRVADTSQAECRLARMRCLANLANCEENKVLMYEHDGLVSAIVRIAHLDDSELTRQHAASVLMDLASAPPNQVSMASDDRVLGCLVKMTIMEKATSTRESVITALQNLAFCKENRARLVSFKDGVLLEALKQALAGDVDAKARRRAAGALTNLVCEETAERMGKQKGLLDTLAIVTTKDDNLDVQTRASLALTKIANLIKVKMECHEALLDALVVASLSKANNSVSAVLRIKARDPANRERMARHPGVIDTLTDICVSECSKVNDRDNAMRAIMHLINEDRNRKILCQKTVLDGLVAGANYKESDLEEARESAIRAMERLATEHTNRETMSRHPGLLTAVAQAVERESKWEDAGKECEHGYLAKPLLMSLLVAM